jgi:hypothetical protein
MKPRVGLAGARMKEARERKAKETVNATKSVPSTSAGSKAGAAAGVAAASAAAATSRSKPEEAVIEAHPASESEVTAPEEENGDDAPSDIESYDDAFESEGEERVIDDAHLRSAIPHDEEGKHTFDFGMLTPEPGAKFKLEVPALQTQPEPQSVSETEETQDEVSVTAVDAEKTVIEEKTEATENLAAAEEPSVETEHVEESVIPASEPEILDAAAADEEPVTAPEEHPVEAEADAETTSVPEEQTHESSPEPIVAVEAEAEQVESEDLTNGTGAETPLPQAHQKNSVIADESGFDFAVSMLQTKPVARAITPEAEIPDEE